MEPFGFLNVDKPLGLTSHDVVAKLRRAAKTQYGSAVKIGHAGTLDPLATGVLVICLGQATRLSEYVMDTTKKYRARVHLGVSTTTYDAEGEVTAQHDAGFVSRDLVVSTLTRFVGDIEQIPPMYSAIKQGGRKLYELAREGKTVERAARSVRIDSLDLIEWDWPECTLEVTCSAGTYIRSLAHDLGEVLGCGAHLTALTRTASGNFLLENASSLELLLQTPDWNPYIVPPQEALQGYLPSHRVNDDEIIALRQGKTIHAPAGFTPPFSTGGLSFANAADGSVIAIIQWDDQAGVWRPHKVFNVDGNP